MNSFLITKNSVSNSTDINLAREQGGMAVDQLSRAYQGGTKFRHRVLISVGWGKSYFLHNLGHFRAHWAQLGREQGGEFPQNPP